MATLKPGTCAMCRKPVLWLPMAGRPGIVALESLDRPAGDIAIQIGLLGTGPVAVRVASGSTYREHAPHCPKAPAKAHSTGGRRKSR
jgi:hypothetical protein